MFYVRFGETFSRRDYREVDGTTRQLREKVAKRGVLSLYDGAGGTYVATAVGHFPWFVTNNYFDKLIPKVPAEPHA